GTAKLNTLRHRRRLRVNTTKRTRHVVGGNTNSNRAMQAAREAESARISHEASGVKQSATKAVTAINDLNNARPKAGTVPRRVTYAAPLVRLAMLATNKVLRGNDTADTCLPDMRVT